MLADWCRHTLGSVWNSPLACKPGCGELTLFKQNSSDSGGIPDKAGGEHAYGMSIWYVPGQLTQKRAKFKETHTTWCYKSCFFPAARPTMVGTQRRLGLWPSEASKGYK